MRCHWLIRGVFLILGAALASTGCVLDGNGLQASDGAPSPADRGPTSDAPDAPDALIGSGGGGGSGGEIAIGSGGASGSGGRRGTGGTDGGAMNATGGMHGTGGNNGSGGTIVGHDGGTADGRPATGGKGGTGGGGTGASAGGGAAGGRLGSGGSGDHGGGGAAGTGGVSATGGRGTGGVLASGGAAPTGGSAETGGRAAGGHGGGGGGGVGGSAGEAGAGGSGGLPGGCGPSTCRNGCCDGNTCVTAERSRLLCGNGGIACAACAPCFQCSRFGSCDLDPASNWTLSCQSATIAATKPNGAPWDIILGSGPAGAEPDPFCEFQLHEIGQRDTEVLMNTRTPVWNQSITPRDTHLTASWLMSHAGDWSVLVGDDDGMNNDAACQVFPSLTPPSFSTGTLVFRNDSCTSLTVQLICDE